MCGIAGFVGLDDESLLREMAVRIAHRGPDAEGFFVAPGVGLAHRRLSVIDLENGRQPMGNETGDIQVVFNGEIYNYQELTRSLKDKGHRFRSSSDTETIVHLYEEHGADCVKHLRGMFAFALWDAPRQRLLLARDRIGEKPLFYLQDGSRLYFASEIKSILAAPLRRQVNHQSVCEFLAAGYVPAPRTFYQGVQKLPPGHVLVMEAGRSVVSRYWDLHSFPSSSTSFSRACTDLGDLLRQSMALCLKSDVEVGAFLSGGLDSSLVVALMRELNAQVQTFSIGYRGAAVGFNELNYARRVSEHLGTRHHELILDASSSLHLLPRILWHYDEPHGEPTSVLVYLLCEFTRRDLTVALGGTGGDELFFGYPRHKAIRLLQYYQWVPSGVRREVIERIAARWPESTRGNRFAKRIKRFIHGGSLPVPEAYLSWVSLLPRDVRHGLFSQQTRDAAPDSSGDRFMLEYLTRPDEPDFYRRAAALDIGGYLPEYQLTYMDRMSMAHGLEVRSPFCDYRLAEFATSLPAQFRLKGGRSKHILKTVARQWLPADIVDRKKVGFDSPIGQWFKAELRPFLEQFLSVEQVGRSGLLEPQAVQQLVQHHLSGLKDYSLQLWSVIALEAWYRLYVEGRCASASDAVLSNLRGVPTGMSSPRSSASQLPAPLSVAL